ncbi:MAG TPA: metal-dependent hydrolase [Vicinamibacteria bacterium]
MDNLTHSLLGAALAQAARPPGAAPAQQRLFMAAGVVSANLPDIDLLYVGITPEPLGYLLHHRGHTHTFVGVAAQAVLLAAVWAAAPWMRRAVGPARLRIGALVAVGLLSHIPLDATNSYGVHPFHPFETRWYYGDAVFILEPWLWLALGIPVAWSAGRTATRVALLATMGVLLAVMAAVGVVVPSTAAAVAAGAALIAVATRPLGVAARTAAALGAGAALVAAQFALSARADTRARAELRARAPGEIVDVVRNPNPADPLCWMVIAIEKREAAGEFVLHAGTLSLAPRLRPPAACASHRFTGGAAASPGAYAAWGPPRHQPLGTLRALAREDCWVRAWLQFGRAPAFEDGAIVDLRFAPGARGNFTALPLHERRAREGCPGNLTSWALPRADLLEGAPAGEPASARR